MNKLVLPTLRGKIGDWFFYVTIIQFGELAKRVSMANEIHENEELSRLIQREVSNRTKGIVEYILTQEQRFFNSLILGIYGGNPSWQEIKINNEDQSINEVSTDYFSKTFGILTLNGQEKIFAIDGQHRTKSIRDVLDIDSSLANEEIAAIFVAHKDTQEGEIRTRRLFSTLNRYAKPVSKSEIIALDEEDNCAIITRNLVDNFSLFQGVILFNKNRSISLSNVSALTNIIVLYDIIRILLLKGKFFGVTIEGEDKKLFTHRRTTEEKLHLYQKKIEDLFVRLSKELPFLVNFFEKRVM